MLKTSQHRSLFWGGILALLTMVLMGPAPVSHAGPAPCSSAPAACRTAGQPYPPFENNRSTNYPRHLLFAGEPICSTPAECGELGHRYLREQDPHEAYAYLRQACLADHLPSCDHLGDVHLIFARWHRSDREGHQKTAVQAYARACEGGEAQACSHLGYYERDLGTRKLARVATLFRQGCEGGDPLGCRELGDLYLLGKGLAQDIPKAQRLFHRACRDGDLRACSLLSIPAEELRVDQTTTDLPPPPEPTCRDCPSIPWKSPTTAVLVQQLRHHCERGVKGACYQLAVRLRQENLAEAAQSFDRACQAGDFRACHQLGIMVYFGEGIPQDFTLAAQYFRRACHKPFAWGSRNGSSIGTVEGCENLALLYLQGKGVEKDPAEAARLFRKACLGRFYPSCHGLGVLYARGLGVQKSHTKAARWYREGCDGNDAPSCTNLGMYHLHGETVPRDLPEAGRLLGKAFWKRAPLWVNRPDIFWRDVEGSLSSKLFD